VPAQLRASSRRRLISSLAPARTGVARGNRAVRLVFWPDNIPEGLSAKERNNTVREWLVTKRLSVPNDIAKAIQRVLKTRQLRKDKTVPAPHSRAAPLAAADAKAFAEAISRRDESQNSTPKRQNLKFYGFSADC
jgi:hypothetical protein